MAPLGEHRAQELMGKLTAPFAMPSSNQPEVRVFPGVNVSDRKEGWEKNYRCPDVAVVLPGSRAVDCGAFFCGGPDFCRRDHQRLRPLPREIRFLCVRSGVRELLLVDRNPWQLELYRLSGATWKPAGVAEPDGQQPLKSQVLPLTFKLLARPSQRPQIEVANPATGERWLA